MDPILSVKGTSDAPLTSESMDSTDCRSRAMKAAEAASSKPPAGSRPAGRQPRHGRREAAKGEMT